MNDLPSAYAPDVEMPTNSVNLGNFLNLDYGVIGRTASTKFEPNTSSEFQFWLSKLTPHAGGERSKNQEMAPIEIGNIVAGYSDQENDVTFGMVTEMRSYSDVESFIADYLSHDFGDATVDSSLD